MVSVVVVIILHHPHRDSDCADLETAVCVDSDVNVPFGRGRYALAQVMPSVRMMKVDDIADRAGLHLLYQMVASYGIVIGG